MTKTSWGGILALVVGVVTVIPAIASAGPIHIAPQWPGGGLNGSQAARNARREAHANQRESTTTQAEEAESDAALDSILDDFENILTPSIPLQLEYMDGGQSALSLLPPLSELAGVPNPFGPQLFSETSLRSSDASGLNLAANPPALTTVPEPGSLLLLGSGVAGVIVKVRRRRRNP